MFLWIWRIKCAMLIDFQIPEEEMTKLMSIAVLHLLVNKIIMIGKFPSLCIPPMFYHSRPYIIECSLNPYPLSFFIDSFIKTLTMVRLLHGGGKESLLRAHVCAYFMNIEFINLNLNSSRPNLTFHVQYSLLVLRSRDYVWRFGTLLLLRWNIKLQKYRWMIHMYF